MNSGFSYRERIGSRGASTRLLDYLAERYDHTTAAGWRSRLTQGQVLVDGERASSETVLSRGAVLVWQRPPWREPRVPLSFAVLYEDADLLAVAKPSGLPTIPGGGFLEHTLMARVRRRYPDAAPAHRLGRGTSGIVLFARSQRARAAVAAAWRCNAVLKIYRALVNGNPSSDQFTIDTPIGRVPHPHLGSVHAASPVGKRSRSFVYVLERRGENTLVEVVIETGRPHQIRIHLAAAGLPLFGDPFYLAGGVPSGRRGARPGEVGYRLHAMTLELEHPAGGRPLRIECRPPADLRLRG